MQADAVGVGSAVVGENTIDLGAELAADRHGDAAGGGPKLGIVQLAADGFELAVDRGHGRFVARHNGRRHKANGNGAQYGNIFEAHEPDPLKKSGPHGVAPGPPCGLTAFV